MNKPFIEVFDDCTKYAKKIQTSDFLRKGKYAIIDQSQEYISGYANNEEGLYDKYPVIIFGDHTRIIKYIDFPFFLGADGTKILQPKIHESDCKYLFYFLLNAKIPNTGYNRHYKWLKELDVPIPPLDEQKKIADKLDKITVLIAKRKFQLEKLDLLVKSRFIEMFGCITNNEHDFEIKELQEVCEQIKDGTHQTPTYTDDVKNGYKFLSSKDVTSGRIDWSNIKYIPESLHEKLYSRVKTQKGDILLAKNGTTGIAAVVENDDIFDIYVSLALIRPIKINSVYLWAAVNSYETKRQFNGSLKGIGVPNLHLGEIKKTKILVPPIELQTQFSAFVHQVDKSKFEIHKGLEKLETLKKALMQQYFG